MRWRLAGDRATRVQGRHADREPTATKTPAEMAPGPEENLSRFWDGRD
jgi:hypothetical protein